MSDVANVMEVPFKVEALQFEVVDEQNKIVAPTGAAYDEVTIALGMLRLPHDACLRFNISHHGAGVPKDQSALLDLGIPQSWVFSRGDKRLYYLRGRFSVEPSKERTWSGTIEMPEVKIPTTKIGFNECYATTIFRKMRFTYRSPYLQGEEGLIEGERNTIRQAHAANSDDALASCQCESTRHGRIGSHDFFTNHAGRRLAAKSVHILHKSAQLCWFAPSLRSRGSSLSDAWFAQSSRITRASFFLNSVFSTDVSTDLRLPSGTRVIFVNPSDLGTKTSDFQARFPNNLGYFVVSRVGLNLNKTEALLYVDHFCGGLCGGGEYVLMRKVYGVWHVVDSHGTWVS